MEAFIEAVNLNPEWVQPKLSHRKFELRADENVFASLEFQSAWGSLAIAECSEGSWTFKRVGFFTPRVTIRLTNVDVDLAIYRPKWTGTEGELTFSNGSHFHWKAANFWATQYSFIKPDGSPILTFKPGVEDSHISDFFKYQARLEIDLGAANLPELPILALLGWYLMILQQDDAAGAAAASASAAS